MQHARRYKICAISIFLEFVVSTCHTSDFGFSVLGLNIFIFSQKCLSVLLTIPLKCFVSYSSLVLAIPFKSKLQWLGIMERLQGSRTRQNEAGILALLYTGPKSFGRDYLSNVDHMGRIVSSSDNQLSSTYKW